MLPMTATETGPRRETLDDLAILGGPPAFDQTLHVGRPNVSNPSQLQRRVGEIVARRWLTNDGPVVREFEQRVADLAGVEHCIATSSGTAGLQLAARALGFDGQVVVPSFTFVATVHALTWLGLTPVFCEIDPRTHTVDPDALESVITPETSGVIAVHLWGRPCDIGRLSDLAHDRGLPLLFDAAHAFNCSYRGEPIGGFGDAEVFSFHGTKFVNAAEGGAVTTNNAELADRMRLMRNFGFSDFDTVIELGTNAKMSELSAAMGLTSLEGMDEFVAANRRNYLRYERELGNVPGLSLMRYDNAERHNYQFVVLELTPEASGDLRRDELVAILHAENVLARRYFHPGCHRLDAYRDAEGGAPVALPATEALASRVVTLPTGTAVDETDVAVICSIVRVAAEHAAELRGRLAGAADPHAITREQRSARA